MHQVFQCHGFAGDRGIAQRGGALQMRQQGLSESPAVDTVLLAQQRPQ